MNVELRRRICEVIPWNAQGGYTTLLRREAPKHKSKGVLHIACVNFGPRAFHGEGVYVAEDAALWLRNLQVPADLDRLGKLDVTPVFAPASYTPLPASGGDPVSGGVEEDALLPDLSCFGYGADGPTVNSTRLFALVAMVLFSLETSTPMPKVFVDILVAIPAPCGKRARAGKGDGMLVESARRAWCRNTRTGLQLIGNREAVTVDGRPSGWMGRRVGGWVDAWVGV